MVFGSGYKRRRSFKPAQLTTNHCETPNQTTVGGTTLQTAIFTTIEPPTNRGSHIPAAAILKGVDIQIWSLDDPPTSGRHRCFMLYQPAATTYADPIAAWLSTADPLTEEAIQVRQHKMGRMTQFITTGDPALPPYHRCRWRGNISLRDGDDIVLALFDDNSTEWVGLCTAWWIA